MKEQKQMLWTPSRVKLGSKNRSVATITATKYLAISLMLQGDTYQLNQQWLDGISKMREAQQGLFTFAPAQLYKTLKMSNFKEMEHT